MPYAVLIFGTRKAGLSPEEFKDYYENKHIPLVKSLTGDQFPKSNTRHYITSGAVAQPAFIVGEPSDLPWDSVTALNFADEEHFNKCMAIYQDEETQKKFAADEEIFLDRASMKIVILGDVRQSVNEALQ
jgi:hypothetical protein